eukprot:6172231-Pleurochrysis_carterae.AAC.3
MTPLVERGPDSQNGRCTGSVSKGDPMSTQTAIACAPPTCLLPPRASPILSRASVTAGAPRRRAVRFGRGAQDRSQDAGWGQACVLRLQRR